jgi:hypothetical protein
LVSWWRGGEATGNGADRLHGRVGRQRRVERMKKKNRENGGGEVGGIFFMAARWHGAKRKKAGGPAVWRRVEEKMRKREGGPGRSGWVREGSAAHSANWWAVATVPGGSTG